eukprot:GHVR01047690.1.p1 GENE.GHVR01047690.1~~GHVR01047690.1.p1  ORF type:complete len:109 (-),score=27.85 GHVR01047690.1:140-466(-)
MLLPFLLSYTLTSTGVRNMLIKPKSDSEGPPPVCFCHNKRILEAGFLCSSCLAILCKSKGVCPCCSARFKPKPFWDEQIVALNLDIHTHTHTQTRPLSQGAPIVIQLG